jgi:hypothetical protein
MNGNLPIFTITGAILVASLSQGCTTVKPNPADSTAPKVEFPRTERGAGTRCQPFG